MLLIDAMNDLDTAQAQSMLLNESGGKGSFEAVCHEPPTQPATPTFTYVTVKYSSYSAQLCMHTCVPGCVFK